MKKFLLLSFLILILFSSFVLAKDVAYIVKNTDNPDSNFVDVLNELELTYDIIDDSAIASTNFANYKMILLGNEKINNVPVNNYKSLFTNPDYYVGWSAYKGSVVSSQPLKANNIDGNSITEGSEGIFRVYTQAKDNSGYSLKMYYLYGRKYGAEKITTTTDSLTKYVVSTKQNPRRAFFGISQTNYWTSESRQLFENAIYWVMWGDDRDGDGFFSDADCDDNNAEIWQILNGYLDNDNDGFGTGNLLNVCSGDELLDSYSNASGDCNDNNAEISPSEEEIPYDSMDNDCSSGDLADVDNDGYCLAGYYIQNKTLQCNRDGLIGSDCNDDDTSIYPGAYDPVDDINQNCVNDLPVFSGFIPNHIWNEDSVAENAYDLNNYFKDRDGDRLEFRIQGNINIDAEIVDSFVNLIPQDDFYGTERVVFIASDGSLEKSSNEASLTVLPINDAPVLEEMEDIKAVEGQLVKIIPNAGDIDNDVLHYSYSSPFNSKGEWQTKLNDYGEKIITVTVNDGNGGTDSIEVRVEILPKLVINEFVSIPDEDEEWIELYNPHNFSVLLEDFTLEDGTGNVDELSGTINSYGYFVFNPNFVLNNNGDIIILKNSELETDKVAYGNWDDGNIADNAELPMLGNSAARIPDGKDTDKDNLDFQVLTIPTKGLSNLADVTPPVVSLISPEDNAYFETDSVVFNYTATDNKAISLSCGFYSDINGTFVELARETINSGARGDFFASNIADGSYEWNVECSDGLNENFAAENFVFTINDTPYLIKSIEDLELDEDTIKEINLKDYFGDKDNPSLSYNSSQLENINVAIANGIAKLTPKENWNGEETAKFTACDKEKCIESNEFLIKVLAVNDKPVLNLIADIVKNEGEKVEISASATDVDNEDLTYSINDTRFEQDENVFSWQTGYEDSEVYNFEISVSDGSLEDIKIVKVEIKNVNEPPHLQEIPDLQIEEDSEFLDNISLNATDNDGFIVKFEVIDEDINKVDCSVTDGKLGVKPAKDFYGTGEQAATCTIQAVDNENGKDEKIFKINVTNVNDKPEIIGFSPDYNPKIAEDGIQEFNVAWRDIDNNNLDVSVRWFVDEIEKGIGDNYIFTGDGTAKEYDIKAVVDDSQLQDVKEWQLTTSSLPLTEKYNGETTDFSDIEDLSNTDLILEKLGFGKIEFLDKVNLEDVVDLDLYTEIQKGLVGIDTSIFTSLLNKKAKITFSGLSFNKTPAIYYNSGFSLDASKAAQVCPETKCSNIVYDSLLGILNFEVNSFSTFVVGDTLSCSQKNGFTCKEKEICRGNLIEARETNSCCSVACTVNFEKEKVCVQKDNNILVEIENPDDEDEFKVGETIKGKVNIENNYEEDKDLDVKIVFYDLTSNKEIDDIKEEADIKDGDDETIEFEFNVENGLNEEHEYYIYVKAEDDVCNDNYVKIIITKEEDDVVIDEFGLPETAKCGDWIEASFRISNIGSEDEDVYLTLENKELKISEKSKKIKIRAEKEGTELLSIKIPEDAEAGNYTFNAAISFAGEKRKEQKSLVLGECLKKQIVSYSDDKLVLGGIKKEVVGESPSLFDKINNLDSKQFLMLIFDMIIGLGIFLVFVFIIVRLRRR